jgi:hypothetical protein
MLIFAGLEWIIYPEDHSKSSERIKKALTGLVMAAGSYAILYAVNPELVQFKSLRIPVVKGIPLTLINEQTYQKITGQAILPKGVLVEKAIAAGKTAGLDDDCYMVTILAQESGARPNAVGHDENYPGSISVHARRDFLVSGKKSSGNLFTPPFAAISAYIPATHNPTSIINDDNNFSDSPPDYGLDWRFSHGLGLGQVTLFSDSFCSTGLRGLKDKTGKCYTIPDLLTPEKNLEYSANLFKGNLDCAAAKNYTGDDKIMAALLAYNAGCKAMQNRPLSYIKTNEYVVHAMNLFTACKNNPKTKTDIPDPTEVIPSTSDQN